MNEQPQAPRLIITHPEAVTTHKVAESLIKLAMMLRRLPDLPCTNVEFWLSGGQPVFPEEQQSADQ
jgi:hypothetical protein